MYRYAQRGCLLSNHMLFAACVLVDHRPYSDCLQKGAIHAVNECAQLSHMRVPGAALGRLPSKNLSRGYQERLQRRRPHAHGAHVSVSHDQVRLLAWSCVARAPLCLHKRRMLVLRHQNTKVAIHSWFQPRLSRSLYISMDVSVRNTFVFQCKRRNQKNELLLLASHLYSYMKK